MRHHSYGQEMFIIAHHHQVGDIFAQAFEPLAFDSRTLAPQYLLGRPSVWVKTSLDFIV